MHEFSIFMFDSYQKGNINVANYSDDYVSATIYHFLSVYLSNSAFLLIFFVKSLFLLLTPN